MGIYTKTGDKGTTGLFTGERVPKNCTRVEAYGTIDEMNSVLAAARAFAEDAEVREWLFKLQKHNMILMSDLASIDKEPGIKLSHVEMLEEKMDEIEKILPPFKAFIIPGDTKAGSFIDMARTISRRAERRMLTLAETDAVPESDRLYMNRLSDFCFMLMRLEEYRTKEK